MLTQRCQGDDWYHVSLATTQSVREAKYLLAGQPFYKCVFQGRYDDIGEVCRWRLPSPFGLVSKNMNDYDSHDHNEG